MEYFYFENDPQHSRACFSLSHSGQMNSAESWQWLNRSWLDNHALANDRQELIAGHKIMAINKAHPRWPEITAPPFLKGGLRLNLVACGDVGSTALIGLRLLAGETISSIGIYDLKPENSQRWEFELNQITDPAIINQQPRIEIITKGQLFDCDVFVFCATAGVPALNAPGDVRLLQYQKNAAIIAEYARLARQSHFSGLFAVVSDPVDHLCHAAFCASNKGSDGQFDGQGLLSEQIEGYGLGVMYARAAYYAQKEARFASFLSEGRAYGPHGGDLVIANSIAAYDDALSRELTELAVKANLQAREWGFKPFVAPALSSAVFPLLATLRGEWHYSSTFLGGVFMGCRSRRLETGIELEAMPLPAQLAARLEQTAKNLAAFEPECF